MLHFCLVPGTFLCLQKRVLGRNLCETKLYYIMEISEISETNFYYRKTFRVDGMLTKVEKTKGEHDLQR